MVSQNVFFNIRSACSRISIVSLVLVCLMVASGTTSVMAQTSRIVAIGDVHGDLKTLTSILRKAELIDENMQWTGGTTVLVQLGDILDRGTNDRGVMDLYMALEKQAPKSGGRVEVLLGNKTILVWFWFSFT